MTKRPIKSQEGRWKELREIGGFGEKYLEDFLKEEGYSVLSLNFRAPCDDCHKIMDWRKFNKLPDGIAKKYNELFFYDSKTKRSRKFYVNVRDYKEYIEKLAILPVKIYFIITDYVKPYRTKEIYIHEVKNKEFPIVEVEHDKNKVYDLANDIEQIR